PTNTKSASELREKVELSFLNLNLFPSRPTTIDEYRLRNQRISTRLFIFLLTISLCILLLYTSLINITEIVNVKTPSIKEYTELYNSYSETLACECTQISINYKKFIQIQYTLHQICHSDFVTQEWFYYLATSPGNDGKFYDTFRVTGTFLFQALYTLCVLVDDTISNRLIQFYSSQYVSASVTPENVFKLQTEAFISQFVSSTTSFAELFSLPGLYTGCYIIESLLQSSLQCFYDQACIDNIILYLGSSTVINVTALDISLSIQYLENSTIADVLEQLMVEDWNSSSIQYVSASVIPSSVFKPQTEAFISQFISSTNENFLLSLSMILNITQSNGLLSGELNNYDIYALDNNIYALGDIYLAAKPRQYGNCSCISSPMCITESVIYDLSNNTLLFDVPGLYTGCYIIESLLQSSLQCFYNQTCINKLQSYFQVSSLMNVTALDISLPSQFLENSTIADLLEQLMVEKWNSSSIYENYYSECQPSSCSYTVTTKNSVIYIVTTLIGLVGGLITVLKFVVPNLVKLVRRKKEFQRAGTETVNIKAPSIKDYKQLYKSYGQTLTCGCTQISINYRKFIQIPYTLHQICHSDFVTQKWIDYLDASSGNYSEHTDDFRSSGTYVFQTINAFCTLVNQTISNRLIQFYSSQYVSASVTPENVFKLQTEAFISQFVSSTTNDFLLSLSMLRNTTQSNGLLSGELSNYVLYRASGIVYRYPRSYGSCTCSSSATCITQFVFYDLSNNTLLFDVPGLYTGCYIIESLLQSSLQCFYNQTCINKLQSYFQVSSLMNVTALDISLPSQFLENSTITDLLEQLMVEKWNSSSIYENYYSECQPSSCSYTISTKNSVIYIVTTLIGLVGGLITVLKLMVPYLVEFIMVCIKKCKGRRATITPLIQT
ncbi:unnamed protein product, partial [Adineta steineri]